MKAVLLAAATCGLVACSGGGDSATLGAPANTLMVMVVTMSKRIMTMIMMEFWIPMTDV